MICFIAWDLKTKSALALVSARTDEEAWLYIPCEAGADVNDQARWAQEAALMEYGAKYAPTLETARMRKLAEIAASRFDAEVGGITLQGMAIDTSRESQALITGAALQATQDSTYTCNWKTAGGFVTLNAQTVLGVATAVRQHVQTCFDREATLSAQIAAAATIEDVVAVSW
jgi:hypothetical protein